MASDKIKTDGEYRDEIEASNEARRKAEATFKTYEVDYMLFGEKHSEVHKDVSAAAAAERLIRENNKLGLYPYEVVAKEVTNG